ncbi:3-dehydroquinate synthase family protein [Micromonospora zhanjiangensis]|uniref:3-dehydroquinate synthase n=1 Tax=Micromonospora zhanjiangensis TaxID=1522057 RepID=A0ABV8KNC3_9ACTN
MRRLSAAPLRQRTIRFADTDVPYRYGIDCAEAVAAEMLRACPDAESAICVVDRRVTDHFTPVRDRLSTRIRVEPFVLDSSEDRKTLAVVQSVLDFAVARGADRRTPVVAMGGGLVGNVAGLASALLFRGTRLIHLPTTPVAAFDSVLSLKQAVNLAGGKNLCGAFHTPTLIAVDLRWLTTIPRHELATGLAEMAKNVLTVSPHAEAAFLAAMRILPEDPTAAFEGLCAIGINAKLPFLAQDPRERGTALVFEYGHTAGHAVEFLSGGRLSHGEAVAWGMLVAARISRDLGYCGDRERERHRRLLAGLMLSAERARAVLPSDESLRRTLLNDNKRGYLRCGPEELPMVLLREGGGAVQGPDGRPLVPVPVDDVVRALRAELASAA